MVKLGGSHALQPHLRDWLEVLARCGGRIVVVPGGGPFAETVRRAQPVMGFDDRTAHHMALLAMEQYGVAIASTSEVFVPASSPGDIEAAVEAGRVPVWMPVPMVLADADLPQTWDLTSDSLAAWLAGRLRAGLLVMVKHADAAGAVEVDPLFERHRKDSGADSACLGPSEASRLAEVIASEAGELPSLRTRQGDCTTAPTEAGP